jgi:hypothetical protein
MTDRADSSSAAGPFDGPLRAMSTFYTNVPDGPISIETITQAEPTNSTIAVPKRDFGPFDIKCTGRPEEDHALYVSHPQAVIKLIEDRGGRLGN